MAICTRCHVSTLEQGVWSDSRRSMIAKLYPNVQRVLGIPICMTICVHVAVLQPILLLHLFKQRSPAAKEYNLCEGTHFCK